jgi:hypothetical protein
VWVGKLTLRSVWTRSWRRCLRSLCSLRRVPIRTTNTRRRWLRYRCSRLIVQETFIVTQFNDRGLLVIRQEVFVQVKIQIPLVLLWCGVRGLYDMGAWRLGDIRRLYVLYCLGRSTAKEVLCLFGVAPI